MDTLLVLPTVFLLLLTVVQVGLWAHAQHRAQTIAAQALSTARVHGADLADARGRAERAREQLGGTVLRDVQVHVSHTATHAHVQVEADTVGLLPGWSPRVVSQVSGPVEEFTQLEAGG